MKNETKLRIMGELNTIKKEPSEHFDVFPDFSNIFFWRAVLYGPPNSLFAGAVYLLHFTFSESYPNKPPTVRFVSSVFHPNVYPDGQICLDLLSKGWSSQYGVASILLALQVFY